MKTPIPAIEKVIAEKTNLSEENINIRLFWAYKHSLEAGNDLINFYDVIWEHDIEGIPEGKRNSTLSAYAGNIVKRYGDPTRSGKNA